MNKKTCQNIAIQYAKIFDPQAPNSNWYAGITNDLKRRKNEHERDKGIVCSYFHEIVNCETEADARTAEKWLHECGFAIYERELQIVAEEQKSEPSTHVYIFQAIADE